MLTLPHDAPHLPCSTYLLDIAGAAYLQEFPGLIATFYDATNGLDNLRRCLHLTGVHCVAGCVHCIPQAEAVAALAIFLLRQAAVRCHSSNNNKGTSTGQHPQQQGGSGYQQRQQCGSGPLLQLPAVTILSMCPFRAVMRVSLHDRIQEPAGSTRRLTVVEVPLQQAAFETALLRPGQNAKWSEIECEQRCAYSLGFLVLPEIVAELVAAAERRQPDGQLCRAPPRMLQLPQDELVGRLPPRGGACLGCKADQLYDATAGAVAVTSMPVESSLYMRKHVAGGRGVGIQSEDRALLKAT